MNTVKAYEEVVDFIAAGSTPQNVIDFRPSEAAQQRVEGARKRRRIIRRGKVRARSLHATRAFNTAG